MSLFGKPQGQTGGSLFGGVQPGPTTGPSLFSSITGSTNPGQGLFSGAPGQGQGSLFGQNPPTGGGLGNPGGSLFGGNTGGGTNPGGSLFGGNPTGGTNPGGSLFGGNTGGGTNPGGSLFGGNPGGGTNTGGSLFGGNTGGGPNTGGSLFGASGNTGNLFGAAPTNTGGLFSNQPSGSGGGLFSQPTANTGGLFGNTGGNAGGGPFSQPTGGTGLFGGNTGTSSTGLFGQPSAGNTMFGGSSSGSFFNNPTQNTGFFNNPSNSMLGQNLSGTLTFNPNAQPTPMPFVPSQDMFSKKISELSDATKNNLFNFKGQIDRNEASLSQSESILNSITKYKNELKERLITLFTFSRRVQTGEKRCKVTIETVKKFQGNVNSFVKEAVKVFNHCDSADQYHQIQSPAGFLSDMLIVCEERLKCIEDNFKEIQEIVSVENRPFELSMLINTIAMMQEKFELVSSVAYDVHKRVQEVLAKYPGIVDNSGNAKKKEGKVDKGSGQKGYSSLRDIITGRLRDFEN